MIESEKHVPLSQEDMLLALRALVLIHGKQIAQLEKDAVDQAERIEALEKCLEE